MGAHPINLALRFILEVATLIAVGNWGWKQSDSWTKFLLAFGLPILSMAIWGLFAVPNDPSRSGSAPIITPGLIRLAIELVFFALGIATLISQQSNKLALIMAIVVVGHYAFSYDRIQWLLEQ